MVRGAWRAAVHELAKSVGLSRLRQLSMHQTIWPFFPLIFFFLTKNYLGMKRKESTSVCVCVWGVGWGGHGVVVEGLSERKAMQMPALRTEAGFPGDLSLWVQ